MRTRESYRHTEPEIYTTESKEHVLSSRRGRAPANIDPCLSLRTHKTELAKLNRDTPYLFIRPARGQCGTLRPSFRWLRRRGPTPTKTLGSSIQSSGKDSSSSSTSHQVRRTRDLSRALFPYLYCFVISRSMVSLLFIVCIHLPVIVCLAR